MVSKIEDASLPNQVPKDETTDPFHNFIQRHELIVLSFIISTSYFYVEFNIYERCSIRQCLWKKKGYNTKFNYILLMGSKEKL
jgi:hypothetical protein